MKNSFSKNLKYLAFITQVGITMLTPLALCMAGAIYLKKKLGIGEWVIILAILLGIAAGMLNSYRLIMSALKNKNDT